MPTYALKKSGLLTVLCLIATAVAAQTKRAVVLIATGGTIAMKIDPVKHAPVPAISDEDLLATVPQVSKYATVEVKNVSNVPSDYMDPVRWTALTRDGRHRAGSSRGGRRHHLPRHRHPGRNRLLARPHRRFRQARGRDRRPAQRLGI